MNSFFNFNNESLNNFIVNLNENLYSSNKILVKISTYFKALYKKVIFNKIKNNIIINYSNDKDIKFFNLIKKKFKLNRFLLDVLDPVDNFDKILEYKNNKLNFSFIKFFLYLCQKIKFQKYNNSFNFFLK
jgi:hypothetical protein